MKYEFHPFANIFPLIEGDEFAELCEDIKRHGQRETILLYDDKILDGRNRYRACERIGVEPMVEIYAGDDPLAFVISLNLRRRHLTESQRAMIAAKLANMQSGTRTDLGPTANLQQVSRADAAAMLNVSERTVNTAKRVERDGDASLVAAVESGAVSVSAAADVATLPKEQQAEVVARGEKEILAAAKAIRAKRSEEKRAERIEKVAEIAKGNEALGTEQRYPVIYADPPWRYEHSVSTTREIENQYPTMTLDEICGLPVRELATPDAILFMWATSPKLSESMRVFDAWGFEYRTCAVWDKQKIGMGYYFRQQHELLLVATRGDLPPPGVDSRVSSVISEPRGQHSAKPERFAEIIEAMYPGLPRIELFCRSPRSGWAVWGNQSNAA